MDILQTQIQELELQKNVVQYEANTTKKQEASTKENDNTLYDNRVSLDSNNLGTRCYAFSSCLSNIPTVCGLFAAKMAGADGI